MVIPSEPLQRPVAEPEALMRLWKLYGRRGNTKAEGGSFAREGYKEAYKIFTE